MSRVCLPGWRACIAGALVLLCAGCGGSSSTTTTQTVQTRVRVVDACANGGTATVVAGSRQIASARYFSVTGYHSVSPGQNSFTLALSAAPGASYTPAIDTLTVSAPYMAIAMGRADITSSSDARYPKLVIAPDDTTAPVSGDIRLRIASAAPDSPPVTVLVDGSAEATDFAYGSLSGYLDLPAGQHAIQINQTGTATTLVPSQSFPTTAGHLYTLFVVEPTVSSPAYGIELVDDSTNTIAG